MLTATPEKVKEIEQLAAKRKAAILNSPSDYPSDAKRYFYFDSIDGDDAADGMSPETAWKSVEKTAHLTLGEGDVVLFKRGCIFRGILYTANGVYYSAYGEGEKPKFYASEDASGKDNWVETKYKNIWMYRSMIPYVRDVGAVVINDGQLWGIKVCRNAKEGVRCDGIHDVFNGRTVVKRGRTPFRGYMDLQGDLEFHHDYNDEYMYMYCADGNPGEVFDSIEFSLRQNNVRGENDGVTMDNLCFKYAGIHAFGHKGKNITIQNCEFSWIGGSSQFPEHEMMGWKKPFGDDTTRLGNASEVYGGCNNYVVKDCYFSQIYDAAITAQYMNANYDNDMIMQNIDWHGNLTDCAHYSFELWLAVQNVKDGCKIKMKNVDIYDNICINNGYGWSHQRPDECYTFFYGDPQYTVCEFSNVEFRDNLFANSRGYISVGRMFRKGNGMHFLRNEIYHSGKKLALHCPDLENCDGKLVLYENNEENVAKLIEGKYWEDCKFYNFDKDDTVSEPYIKI